jgi:hypothetical protein
MKYYDTEHGLTKHTKKLWDKREVFVYPPRGTDKDHGNIAIQSRKKILATRGLSKL